MGVEQLTEERDSLRERWRGVRALRLEMKCGLRKGGLSPLKARRYPPYKALVKEQHRLSRMIIHAEKKINKINSRKPR